jgi:nucleoside 2-deoxyribosyltransferase
MKIYVASKWEEKDRVQELMALLREAGHEITYDWTQCGTYNRTQAIHDLRGVADADVFVGVFEKDVPYAGALVELGIALALGKPIYIFGDAPVLARCIFLEYPGIQFGISAFVHDLIEGK